MHVLIVTPEVFPFSSTSATGELVGTLARSLRDSGTRVTLISPYYGDIDGDRFALATRIRKLKLSLGGRRPTEFGLLDGKFPSSDVHLVFVDHESFQRRPLHGAQPHHGDLAGYELLCRSVACIAEELSLDPDVLHAFEWQAALTLLLARDASNDSALGRARRVLTFHDAGSAGLFDRSALDELGLEPGLFSPDGIEFHGKVCLLKAGVLGADMVCATSPARARELRTEEHGAGLHGLFQALGERLVGVPGGIDYGVWDPSSDHRIAERYDADNLEGKAACKRALQQELGLPARAATPLVVCLPPSTGFDRALEALQTWPEGEGPLQVGVFGGADGTAPLVAAASARPNLTLAHHASQVSDDQLHRILAGADALLAPPLDGQGGQLPLKALRYGAIPVVHRVGELSDSVVDYDVRSGTGTGLTFLHSNPEGLLIALHRLSTLHGDSDAWPVITANAMRQRFPMALLARRYLEVYGA